MSSRVFNQVIRTSGLSSQSLIKRGGASLPPPPFVRLPTPSKRVVENYELVWNDGVAPELCIDFDAPHVATKTALSHLLLGLGFFATVGGLVWLVDPDSMRQAEARSESLPDLSIELGNYETSNDVELDE